MRCGGSRLQFKNTFKIMEFSQNRQHLPKKTFFNLKKIKQQIAPNQDGDLKDEQVNEISKKLGS